MLSLTYLPHAAAQQSSETSASTSTKAGQANPADFEAFMLFLADSMEEKGQLVTPLDIDKNAEDSETPATNSLFETKDSSEESK